MHLVHRDGRPEGIPGTALLHPLGVRPVVGQVPHDRTGRGRVLGTEGEGVRLVDAVAEVTRDDVVLVGGTWPDAREETLPRCPSSREPRSGCWVFFQPLKSPMTKTACALGAQTENVVPATPSRDPAWEPSFS